jgi:hypothetical protein
MSRISSTSILIDVLGGNQAVATLTGSKANAVSGWRKTKLPAATYVTMQKKLRKMGLSAPDTLWAMRLPQRRKVQA